MTENAKRVAMTAKALEVCRALVDDDFPTFADRERFMRWLQTVEILPNPEPAPAEAVAALNRMVAFAARAIGDRGDETQHFAEIRRQEKDEDILSRALARLAELEKRQPTEEKP